MLLMLELDGLREVCTRVARVSRASAQHLECRRLA